MSRGMLLVLSDVGDEDEHEFNDWYDREHMRERVAVPGFLGARRYRSETAVRRYCAVYDTESLGVFESLPYRQKLAAQSDWSRRVLTLFVDAHRSVGRITASWGYGYAGTLWLLQAKNSAADDAVSAWMSAVAASPGIVAVRLFESEPQLSGPVKEYRPTTRPIIGAEGRFVLVDTVGPEVIETLPSLPEGSNAGGALQPLGVYSLSWGLTSTDVDQSPSPP